MSGGTPPLGIEPRTCRLTADRSANGALEAWKGAAGIEPATPGSAIPCSTAELCTLRAKMPVAFQLQPPSSNHKPKSACARTYTISWRLFSNQDFRIEFRYYTPDIWMRCLMRRNKRPTMLRPREKKKKFKQNQKVLFFFYFLHLNAKSFFFFFLCTREVRPRALPSSYGHTTVKAPHPIRTAKLSIVGPVQYFGRGLQGNHGCCMSLLFFFLFFIFFYFFRIFLFLQKAPHVANWTRPRVDPAGGRLKADSTMSRCRGGGSDLLYSWSRGKN